MVDRICALKNALVEQAEIDLREKGAERMDGGIVDMIYDLAKAEECCWEAEYYRSVVEAMESYDAGYSAQQKRGNARRGYGHGYTEEIRNIVVSASPEERERMKVELRSMLGI